MTMGFKHTLIMNNFINISLTGAQQIKDTAKELETLTQSVVNAAFVARKNPQDEAANQQLKTVRQQWFNKVNELTSAIDDIIAPHEFAAATSELERVGMQII